MKLGVLRLQPGEFWTPFRRGVVPVLPVTARLEGPKTGLSVEPARKA